MGSDKLMETVLKLKKSLVRESIAKLTIRRFTISKFPRPNHFTKNMDLSTRKLNHWVCKGVLDDRKDSAGKWQRFSISDSFWMQILLELRRCGIALKKIHFFKQRLFESMRHEDLVFTRFDLAIISYWTMKENRNYLFINSQGLGTILAQGDFERNAEDAISYFIYKRKYK